MTFDMAMMLMGWPYDSFDCLLFFKHVFTYLIMHYGLIVIGCSPGVEAFSLFLEVVPGILLDILVINPHEKVPVLPILLMGRT